MQQFKTFGCDVMSEYEKSKTARRIAAVVYLLVLGFILGGTYLSQRQKQASGQANPAMQQGGLSHLGERSVSRFKF
jgi:hypothetical protein